MKTRTFQEIYDFCRTDDTYRSYFDASDESRITGARARKYYYGDIRRGQCRLGTFIYCQSMRQLERFLGGARQDHYIHVDPLTCREVSLKDDMSPRQAAYVVVHVRQWGVQIEIDHPLHDGWACFTARSHRPFTREGIIAEAKSHIDRHILLAPGRYRDLQMEHMVPKEKFPAWYSRYRKGLRERAESEHRDMVDKYRHGNDITHEEARDILAASGIFFDLNCDEFERAELTEEFVRLCNRI